jgi:hypothetical protein
MLTCFWSFFVLVVLRVDVFFAGASGFLPDAVEAFFVAAAFLTAGAGAVFFTGAFFVVGFSTSAFLTGRGLSFYKTNVRERRQERETKNEPPWRRSWVRA